VDEWTLLGYSAVPREELLSETPQPEPADPDIEVRMLLTNKTEGAVRFVLEPWGEVHEMPAGSQVEIVTRGPEKGAVFDVTVEDGLIEMCNWTGSYSYVAGDAQLSEEQLRDRPRTPKFPGGWPVFRELFGRILGRPGDSDAQERLEDFRKSIGKPDDKPSDKAE
jgi:hypothetical protein